MTFGFIEAEKANFPISRMCHVLGVSQSGFFAWQERPACRECLKLCVSDLAHAVFRYVQASKRPANIMAS